MVEVRKWWKNKKVFRWHLKELTEGELQIFKGITFQICRVA